MRISDWSSDLCSSDLVGRRLIPDIHERIVTKFCYAPKDFAADLNAHLGSAFSLEPTLAQSAWFRVHNRDDNIPNLYFVGAGTHPGAGISGVVACAKASAEIGRASWGKACVSTSRSRWSPFHLTYLIFSLLIFFPFLYFFFHLLYLFSFYFFLFFFFFFFS